MGFGGKKKWYRVVEKQGDFQSSYGAIIIILKQRHLRIWISSKYFYRNNRCRFWTRICFLSRFSYRRKQETSSAYLTSHRHCSLYKVPAPPQITHSFNSSLSLVTDTSFEFQSVFGSGFVKTSLTWATTIINNSLQWVFLPHKVNLSIYLF